MSGWTDADIAKLKELWADLSLSQTQIGRKLGRSRNAVAGARERYGLPRRIEAIGGRPPSPPKPEGFRAPKPYTPKEPAKPIEPATLPDGSHYTMATIGPHQYRFPYGEVGTPDFHLCGHAAVGSWCEYHRALCFNTEAMRRAKRAAAV